MKASKLIELLQQEINRGDDLEVRIPDVWNTYSPATPVNRVQTNNDGKSRYIYLVGVTADKGPQ